MSIESNIPPIDPNYSDKAIWDVGVDFAYRQNDVADSIRLHETWLNNAFDAPLKNAKQEEKVNHLLEKLTDLKNNERYLAHAIGMLIGPDGLVTQSPYCLPQESAKEDEPNLQREPSDISYFQAGKVVTIKRQ